ncbi:S9 family peptidase [Limisphaera ngatamarikiensis]|uniref:S9 family peptidase n=1 Tax=Limisphaera ngatamarikiensis TaxID=1324935 RepID=A0A6M1RXY4_9BACT|nr:S9 family peptidase [Limisphaera ngatamarikiensis]NGO38030.1 S9 family peptidase [Limisphaera ngatamarikiensis]
MESRLHLGLLLAALCLIGARGAESVSSSAQGLDPRDVARLQWVTTAVVSPDGQHVAFLRTVPRDLEKDPDGPAWSGLWVYDIETGRERPFVTGRVEITRPAWTPDGRAITFLAKRGDDKHKALWLIPIDGGEARKAAELPTDLADYALAPDGRRVAVVAPEPEPKHRRKLQDKGFNQQVYEEDWATNRLWVLALFEPGEDPRPLPLTGHVHRVEWRPGYEHLAVSLAPTPSVDDSYVRQQIRIVHAGSGEVVATVNNPGKLAGFRWSPDGRRLVMIAAEDAHDPAPGRLMLVDPGTGRFTQLLPDHSGQVEDCAWLNQDRLLVLCSEGVGSALYEVTWEGPNMSRQRRFESLAPVFDSVTAGGTNPVVALVGSHPTHPAELFLWQTDRPGPDRVTDSNPWLARRRLARQELVHWTARDGLALEGILIRRLEDDGRPGPLILSVHGGPEAHVRNGWLTSYSLPGQVAAARGMAVFYPNYRGSTGRGVAFSRLGQGDPAGREFDDLVDAVDHLITIGVADSNRVGVTGGSYGGYATAWCVTRYSDRFAAGVMFVGISDKISKVGTTDIPEEEYLVHARFRPWEKWTFLLERSPIYHAGRCRTPLLILHGKDDPRVHVSQSLEMYRHLKLRSSAPVRLVLYPGEGHGNRRAASRYDYHLRMLQWFEHYLLGPGGEPPSPEVDYGLPEAAEN